MKFSLINSLFCIFSVLLTCQAAVSKKYFRDNVQNHFIPYFESNFFHSLSEKNQTLEGVAKLTTSLLHNIYLRTRRDSNIVLSPISIWATLAMLLEGASGKTENELKTKLRLSYNTHEEGKEILRNRYKELLNSYQAGNTPMEFKLLNFAISDKTKRINPEYKNIIRQYYNGRFFEVDSREKDKSLWLINTWASKMTQNRIPAFVTPAMLQNLLLVIGNAVYFKSKWKYPFDPSMTISMPFKDEYERTVRNVPMLNQMIALPYAYNEQLQSEIVEIPYANYLGVSNPLPEAYVSHDEALKRYYKAIKHEESWHSTWEIPRKDGLTSMIVILPRERISLESVLSRMTRMSMNEIVPNNFMMETIHLFLPRFRIANKMYLNEVLKQDLRSVFSPEYAEFPYIGRNIFVSKIAHKAEIENTEEGTTASAVTSVQFAYKSSNTIFRANRPFIYLINEMKTKTVLFAGTYSNPFVV